MSTTPRRRRAPLPFTLGLAMAAAATTWATMLSWGVFTTQPSRASVPLLFFAAIIALIGGVGRWLRVPLLVVLVIQLIVAAVTLLGTFTGSLAPTPTNVREFATLFAEAIQSAQSFAAPIPLNAPPVTILMLTGGLASLIVVDLLAAGLRRVPLAGLMLLAVYTVPVSITGEGASWGTFVAMSIGFMTMLYLVHSEQIDRWGRGMQADLDGADAEADPTSFGVRTGAVRGSALAIGTSATALALAVPVAIPTLEMTLFEGNGPGTEKIEVSDPMVDLRRDLSRGQDIPLMWVTTPQQDPSYFRLSVLTRFNGNTWTPGDRDIPPEQVARGEMPALAGVASGTNRRETPYHVRVSPDFESGWLPTTPQVSSMDVNDDWRYDLSTMDFMSTDSGVTSADMTYSFTGVEVTPEASLMDNAVSGAASVSSVYTEVPASIPSEIRSLAAAVTGGEQTRFRKARALQQWFRQDGGFTYSDEAIDDDPGSLVAFLDESGRVGYCEQFAASMAIMARIIGIPARVAVGFLNSTPAGANQYEFSSHDLHAWPELYFPGAGWVRFEPTPGVRAETVPTYTETQLAPIASESPSTSAAAPEDELPDRGSDAEPVEPTTTTEESTLPWGRFALAGVGLLAIVGLVLAPSFVRRRRRERRLQGTIEDLWLELRDHSRDLGRGWPAGRSPRATGAWLADWFGAPGGDDTTDRPRHGAGQNPEAVQALDRLVEQVERSRYARSSASVDTEQAAKDVVTIEDALDHGVGPRVRRRARWLPRSLRPSPYTPAGEVVTRETREMSDSVS